MIAAPMGIYPRTLTQVVSRDPRIFSGFDIRAGALALISREGCEKSKLKPQHGNCQKKLSVLFFLVSHHQLCCRAVESQLVFLSKGAALCFILLVVQGSRIEAASVVVKPVVPYSVNRGVPSKRVAFVVCDPFQEMGGRGVFNNNNNNNSDRNENSDSDNSGKGKQGKSGSHGVRRRMFSNYVSPYMGV